ncbi:ATP-binding cassette domain-containing protein [Pararhizobium sp. BT-229]|uniref:ATP-binding cassette domain-containing protein n=1 Tax=Pararhizobium sp. BT-229 TaxID=2986923 RepID=UPI0021F74454|nr:ATP-binding cassette domain-containing protein [Pararhizobium sp. BT-229]MCV9967288.1 ATP-binding cassette domain-containing protein [Pararhizobium sp. BT-229]
MEPDGKTDGLQLDEISIGLAGRMLLSLSAVVRPGDILTVMGPSGSGKSALLAYLGGFLDPVFTASGRILIDRDDITGLPVEKRGAGMLFQDPLLFPHLSVGGNLLFGLTASIRKRDQRRRMAEQALADVELGGFFDRDPATLSGGQKARVALQRVMLSAPRFLLLDEPFSKLDTGLRAQTRALIFSRAKSAGLPIVLVTHDHADAEAAGGRVVTIGEEASR